MSIVFRPFSHAGKLRISQKCVGAENADLFKNINKNSLNAALDRSSSRPVAQGRTRATREAADRPDIF
jgi:hypothetical protein